MKLNNLFTALVAITIALTGCLETDDGDGLGSNANELSFDVAPVFAVTTGSYDRNDVRIERVFLGIGTILLEPVEDPDDAITYRERLPLSFDLTSGHAELGGGSFVVPRPGTYSVSIVIEPMKDPFALAGSGGSGESERNSMQIEGNIVRSKTLGTSPRPSADEPEPLPWMPNDMRNIDGTQLEPVIVDQIPFEFHTNRTAFIRLGELRLTPERNELYIHVELTNWLDEGLAPVLSRLTESDSSLTLPRLAVDSSLDLSRYLEELGVGEIEELFRTTEASAN